MARWGKGRRHSPNLSGADERRRQAVKRRRALNRTRLHWSKIAAATGRPSKEIESFLSTALMTPKRNTSMFFTLTNVLFIEWLMRRGRRWLVFAGG
jgi:hypothetical protein